MIVPILALLVSACGQEVEDGVYSHEKRGIRLTVPKDWTLTVKKEERYGLCDFSAPTGFIRGTLSEPVDLGEDMSAFIRSREMSLALTYKGFKTDKEEKLARDPGQWLLRECSGAGFRGKTMRFVCLYVIAGGHRYFLQVTCAGEDWDSKEKRDAIQKIVSDFSVKELLLEKNEGLRWGASGKGSWIDYRETLRSGSTQSERWVRFSVRMQIGENALFEIVYRNALEGKPVKTETSTQGGVLAMSPSEDASESARGEEEIVVSGKRLKCRWGEYQVKLQGKDATEKVWISDEVPGRIVKRVQAQGTDVREWICVGYEKH